MVNLRLHLALVALLLTGTVAHAEPPKAAVFDFQLADQGMIGPTDADRARLAPLSNMLRSLLKESGRYEIVSTDPVKEEVTKGSDLRRCNGCAEEYAKKIGADVAITGEIQKVSNLILNINVYVKGNCSPPEEGTRSRRRHAMNRG